MENYPFWDFLGNSHDLGSPRFLCPFKTWPSNSPRKKDLGIAEVMPGSEEGPPSRLSSQFCVVSNMRKVGDFSNQLGNLIVSKMLEFTEFRLRFQQTWEFSGV